ncbi:MAG TPA: YdcF family protein [Stellaceae bacterium]|nr:YdcF family protein [Stellaceae bacterium]
MRWPRAARLIRWGLAAAVALGAAWGAGFVWFVREIPAAAGDPDRVTDAIVVLTGGSLRVERGLELLADGKAKKLFISGVYHGVEVGDLLRVSRQAPEQSACCITLGHAADSTFGNALETAAWMRAENFRSLRLVTANYHMPRSLLEFTRAMPDIDIVPSPVFPEISRAPHWWLRPGSLFLAAVEYTKYLVALARPALIGAPRSGGAGR